MKVMLYERGCFLNPAYKRGNMAATFQDLCQAFGPLLRIQVLYLTSFKPRTFECTCICDKTRHSCLILFAKSGNKFTETFYLHTCSL